MHKNLFYMKLGTHNSMSYLPPKKWYLYPFRFMAKCQSVDIAEQYKLGARMFDLRIRYDKNGVPEFRHGSMAFKGNVEDILKYLNSRKARCYIRLLLEVKNTKDLVRQELLFLDDCKRWEATYKGLTFFCGRRKFDWKQLYKFKADDIEVIQKVSSMTGTVLDDLCPILYARLYNKKNYREWDSSKWLLLDFIEYALE